MRKRILLAAASVAAMSIALMLPMSSASADGTIVVLAGPSQYSIGFQHPTGTVSIGGGTVSARCTASSVKGSATFFTPNCVTKPVTCPATASFCSFVYNARESALRGPVWFAADALVTGGSISFLGDIQPYNCPQAYSCGARQVYLMTAGTTIQTAVFNIVFAPNFPNVFQQITLTVH